MAVAYGLFNAQQRGTLIVDPGDKVYEGMVVGYSPAGEDITVNVCKTKHLSNTRASGSDDALRLVPVSKFSLEESLEFLKPDELLEVTPSSIRIRKRILNHDLRMKATKGGKISAEQKRIDSDQNSAGTVPALFFWSTVRAYLLRVPAYWSAESERLHC